MSVLHVEVTAYVSLTDDMSRHSTCVRLVYTPELLEGIGAGDVRVEDKEGRVVLSENLTGEGKRSS